MFNETSNCRIVPQHPSDTQHIILFDKIFQMNFQDNLQNETYAVDVNRMYNRKFQQIRRQLNDT